jgi:hypothetical protein
MSLRQLPSLACLAALALAPLPALAEEPENAPAREHGDVARRLSDPRTQAEVTVALTALSEALLDMRIEPVRRAMAAAGDDSMAELPPDARLRDLAGPGARKLPGEIGRTVPRTMGAVASMAGALDEMLPELKSTAERLRRALPRP